MAGSVMTTYPQRGVVQCVWAALAGTDEGDSVSAAGWADKTVQVSGTFTTITVEGSNDGANWAVLHNLQGDDLVISAAGLEVIAENPLLMRVTSVGAAGVSAIVVGRGIT